MKYVKNNRADEFGTFTQLDGIMKCSAAIATNTALKVAGDERYNGRIAARALYEQIAFCESMLEGFDKEDRKKALGDVRAWLDTEDHSISRAMFGFVRTSGNF